MRGGSALGVFASTVAIAMFGCGDKPTSISVHAFASVPCAALKGVTITALAPGAKEGPTVTTAQCAEPGVDSPDTRIGTLVLLPTNGNDSRVTIRVVAGVDRPAAECANENGYGGCIVARRTLRFVPGKELDLPIILRAECKGMPCDGASTCVRGECRSASVADPAMCEASACDEASLDQRPGPMVVSSDAGDGGTVLVGADGGLVCGASEKICAGACVSNADPQYGCSRLSCMPCPGSDIGEYACSNDACVRLKCKPGYKECAGACVPEDVAHGCGGAACEPCEANNGAAACVGQAGAPTPTACVLTCSPGYKLCGGKCVNVNDPTYGCTSTGCGNSACPDPGGGTLVCNEGSCIIGSCPNGTKNCNQKCVPADVNNGCSDPARCSACGPSDACLGAPAVCTCVPQPLATTCSGKACGTAVNNCGQTVTCPNTCSGANVCGGGGAGPNGCGCNPEPLDTTCAGTGKQCGSAINNCGQGLTCPNTCVAPNTCGGAGNGNLCGCTPLTACYGSCGCIEDGCGGYCCDYSGCGGGGD